MSAVLLKRWTVDDKLVVLDLKTGQVDDERRTRSAGWRPWFVNKDFARPIEEVWEEIENTADGALGLVESGGLFESAAALDVVRDLVALHLVRSHEFLRTWVTARAHATGGQALPPGVAALVADPAFLAGHFEDRLGLVAAGPGAVKMEREQIENEIVELFGDGGTLFVEQLLEKFEEARSLLAPERLEIAVTDGQFLIGDTPCLTIDHETRTIGFSAGAGLRSADTLTMPLGPHHAVAVGGEGGYLEIDQAATDNMNMFQVKAAEAEVYYRPRHDLKAFAMAVRS